MIAVCNTSPVSNLIQIAALPLLVTQFSEVCLPPEVAAELDEGADLLGDWRAAPGATGLETRLATDRALIRELSATLHAGEAAAIALAAEITGAVLVIDESDGRLAAARIGLRFTGTVGVLIAAKRAGHVPALAPLLDALRTRARFWLSDEVVRRALALAGE